MQQQQEMNFFKYYSDGLNIFSLQETLRMLSKGFTESVEMYDVWLQGVHDLTDESFAICRNIADGRKTDTDGLLKASEQMYDNLTNRMTEAMKDTPLKDIESIVKSLKESADIRKNSSMVKVFLQPVIDTGVSVAAMLKSSCKAVSGVMNLREPSPEAA